MLLLLALALALPDPHWTPGAVRPLTTTQVCGTRWGLDRRHVTLAMRQEVFRRYGIPWSQHAQYEVDHLIPRELGGADDLANLWPQPWPDAHEKDKAENAAHRAVCAGTMRLDVARLSLASWGQQRATR